MFLNGKTCVVNGKTYLVNGETCVANVETYLVNGKTCVVYGENIVKSDGGYDGEKRRGHASSGKAKEL